MPPRNNHRRQNGNSGNNLNPEFSGEFRPPETITKSNPKLLSILLQALIMFIVISLFFIFIGVAALIFIGVAGGALRHRRNQRRPISGIADSSSGYLLELLKTLPKSRFKGSDVCAICLDNLLDGEVCRVLPGCNHVFHLNCVDKWILKSPVCPVCRSSIRNLDHEPFRDTGALGWEHLSAQI